MFWQEFEDRLGPLGREPSSYYQLEVGHVLHLSPDDLGEVTPATLVEALHMFDALYRSNG